MKTLKLFRSVILSFSFFILAFSCSSDDSDNNDSPSISTKDRFSGSVQKGPYIIGSSITITQLDSQLNQTGKTYSTTVIDNAGNFELKDTQFTSNYVELKAEGYYFNEVKGEISTGPLTLYALVDIKDINSVNINLLTHLEKPRIEYLIKEKRLNFSEAKKQASQEVLKIFGLSSDGTSSEKLDISKDEILLAISTICQGYLPSGNISELLAYIANDIKTDGKLDNTTLGSRLINNVSYVDANEVAENTIKKYKELGIAASLSSEKLNQYIQQFINNSGFERTLFITYPERGRYGLNILAESFTSAKKNSEHSMKVEIPEGASDFKIVIKSALPEIHNYWGGYTLGRIENWLFGDWDYNIKGNVVTVLESGKNTDAQVILDNDFIIEYYENGSNVPTKTKTVRVTD